MGSVTLPLSLPYTYRSFVVEGSETDATVVETLAGTGSYEPWLVDTMARVVGDTSVCLDVGANIGVMTIAMGVRAPAGRVFAFEAVRSNYDYLVRNLAANDLDHCQALHLAAYDTAGEVAVDVVDGFPGRAYVPETDNHEPGATSNPVSCVRLSDWCEASGLERVDVIKMDIEGSEVRALHGAAEMIARFEPSLIVEVNEEALVTFQGSSVGELFRLLRDLYPKVAFIDRATSQLEPVDSMADFDAALARSPTRIEDLLCTF